jgi:Holliday junction resolvase
MSAKKGKYMAATKEKLVKTKCVALLKERGVYYFFPATFGMGASGLFDIVACHRGWFIGIECKADAGKRGPTELQSLNARRSKTAGAIVLLIDAKNYQLLAEVLLELEKLDDKTNESERLSFWPTKGTALGRE